MARTGGVLSLRTIAFGGLFGLALLGAFAYRQLAPGTPGFGKLLIVAAALCVAMNASAAADTWARRAPSARVLQVAITLMPLAMFVAFLAMFPGTIAALWAA
jgi:hypothetical protein